jgi:hypothetical protein
VSPVRVGTPGHFPSVRQGSFCCAPGCWRACSWQDAAEPRCIVAMLATGSSCVTMLVAQRSKKARQLGNTTG